MAVKEESDKKIIISTLRPEKNVYKCLFTASCPHPGMSPLLEVVAK